MNLLTALTVCSGSLFLVYGGLCLSSPSMKSEFTRFGLGRFRTLIGTLELLGGMGLLVGLRWPPSLWISSGGLSLLMLCGLGVRIRIGDGFARSLPALLLMIVNAYIFIESLRVA